MTNLHILISGGSGLIGQELTYGLLKLGHTVSILSRKPQEVSVPDQVNVIAWDARTLSGWEQEIEKTDAVVHLAGESIAGSGLFGLFPQRWTPYRKELISKSRIESGQVLSKAIEGAQNKPQVFIQASAIGYYGPSDAQIITESESQGTDFAARVCQSWESSSAVIGVGVRRIVARFGLPLSIKGGFLPRVLFPYKMFVGGPIGNGKQYYSWIHMDDTVQSLIYLIENEENSGVFNITAPNPVTNSEFGRKLGDTIKRPHWMPVPGLAFRALFGEVADVVVTGQRVIPERLEKAGFSFRYPNIEKALQNTLSTK
ncbi:MAG: TIGR01777 family oxidoreductase [Anaerolineales bacterium]